MALATLQKPLCRRLALVGVGLIGGSLTLALKQAGAVGEVIGWDRDAVNLQLAVELGVVDRAAVSLATAVADADLVVLALPVQALAPVAVELLPHLAPGTVLTDTGSVKESVVAAIEPLALRCGCHFVGGHPISGTERSGAVAAFASLYQGKRCILTPTPATDGAAVALVTALWQAAGSAVVQMDVRKHDRILAAISHLPHMIAYALVNAVSAYDQYPENILEYTAGGFRDFTRIASSDPVMWRDIALENRAAVLEMIAQFERFLAELKGDIERADGAALQAFFRQSKISRDAIAQSAVRGE